MCHMFINPTLFFIRIKISFRQRNNGLFFVSYMVLSILHILKMLNKYLLNEMEMKFTQYWIYRSLKT